MPKTVIRKNLKQFGRDGASTNFGQFGSVNAASPLKTKDIETIQALSAWLTGFQDEVVASNKAPFLEDMNSLVLVLCYQLFYLLQEGMPEWDVDTTYFASSLARRPGTTEIWVSRVDDNTGNSIPTDMTPNFYWDLVYPVRFITLLGSIAIGQIPDGLITAAKIVSLATSQLTGLITNAQIQSLDVSKLTGILPKESGGTGKTFKLVNVTTYTGTGITGHTVPHGLSVVPDLVVIVNQAAVAAQVVMWAPTMQSGSSRWMNGTPSNNDIVAGDATNITLGTSPYVNASLGGYTMFAFKGQQ